MIAEHRKQTVKCTVPYLKEIFAIQTQPNHAQLKATVNRGSSFIVIGCLNIFSAVFD